MFKKHLKCIGVFIKHNMPSEPGNLLFLLDHYMMSKFFKEHLTNSQMNSFLRYFLPYIFFFFMMLRTIERHIRKA